jgi:anti-sigma28 factor (negative regulator of flagellin synthesis)
MELEGLRGIEGIREIELLRKVVQKKELEPEKIQRKDKVEISKEAEKLKELQRRIIKDIPDIRMDKILEVKKRIKAGFYSKKEVIEGAAEKLSEYIL